MNNLKKEYKSFLDDIEKNIKNEEDLKYIKKRFAEFSDVIIQEITELTDLKNDKIEKIEELQKSMDEKITKIQKVITNIENDIYSENEFDLEIICPYCSYNFILEDGEEKTEIECPECKNTIELDWDGDLQDEEFDDDM